MTGTDSTTLSAAEFDALFNAFTTEVARLEALSAYAVGGSEQQRLDAFRGGHPRPLRSVRTDPWLARIAVSSVIAGKSWTRIRVVDTPMTDYQRYQMASYRESQAVGEQVRIALRTAVGDVGPDFWLFDGRMVVLMQHDDRPSVSSSTVQTTNGTIATIASCATTEHSSTTAGIVWRRWQLWRFPSTSSW